MLVSTETPPVGGWSGQCVGVDSTVAENKILGLWGERCGEFVRSGGTIQGYLIKLEGGRGVDRKREGRQTDLEEMWVRGWGSRAESEGRAQCG